jgi:hypothetical protein
MNANKTYPTMYRGVVDDVNKAKVSGIYSVLDGTPNRPSIDGLNEGRLLLSVETDFVISKQTISRTSLNKHAVRTSGDNGVTWTDWVVI